MNEVRQEREFVRFLVFSASLRTGSLNTRLAQLAADSLEAQGGEVDHASMREFDAPSFDADVEQSQGLPPAAEELRRRLVASDAFVIAAPEYNASMPGLLKNAVDWVSRSRPQPFHERHGPLLSASPSMAGGNRGLWAHALRTPRGPGVFRACSRSRRPTRPSTTKGESRTLNFRPVSKARSPRSWIWSKLPSTTPASGASGSNSWASTPSPRSTESNDPAMVRSAPLLARRCA